MQIVINMPEEEYNKIKENNCGLFNGRIYQMIRNGAPLQKGHGDLKDINMIYNELDGKSFGTAFDYFNAIDAVDEAPTIIEADNEDKT